MRYIRNISDDQNKAGDTDNIFRFNLLQGEDIFNFGDYPISINIANSSGYILSMVPEKEFGNSVLKLDFNDQSLKSLTPDNYLLEVEVKLPDGTTATFPTKGGMPFTVNSNLKNTAGQLVPTVTFDTVLEAVDKKINNYLATVVKGETGPVGPTGEVDTSKDYTFTGNNTFTQPINGALATRIATFTDFAVVAKNMTDYAGNWVVKGTHIDNSPFSDVFYYTVEVLPGDFKGSGKIILTPYDGNNIPETIFYSIVNWRGILNWQQLALDSTLVHNTGTETVAGDKTFTGNDTFTQPINGAIKVRLATFTDFATVAQDMVLYGGLWRIDGTEMSNSPISGSNWCQVEVQSGDRKEAGVIKLFDRVNEVNYYSTVADGLIKGWKKLAKDETVVHNTGTETVAGDKTFTGNETFTNLINGAFNSTRLVTFTDFADVANGNMIKYSGLWFNQLTNIKNTPTGGDIIWSSIEVLPTSSSSGFIKVTRQITGDVYITGVDNFAIKGWYKVTNDSTVVHNTGNETVAGDKTFTGTNTFTGKTSFWFKQIQWTSGIMQGTWYLQRIGNWINAKFDMSADTGTGTTALSLPVGYRPISAFSRELEQGVAGVKRDGTIYISTAYTGSNAMTFSFPTNDVWPTA